MMAPVLLLALGSTAACLPVEGAYIVAGDMAKAAAAFSSLPNDTRLGYAPSPGARRVFPAREIQRLARRHGLSLASAAETCFEVPVGPLKPDTFLAPMREALGRPEARIEIITFSRHPAPRGRIEFPISGLEKPPAFEPGAPVVWRGAVRYQERRTFRIWARVRISITDRRVVAAEALPAGLPIAREQIRLETFQGFPGRQKAAASLERVVGSLLRRPLPAGSPVETDLLEKPKAVSRGSLVTVEANRGAARIRLEGKALSDGNQGEAVLVRNLSSGKDFHAKVKGPGLAVAGEGDPQEAK